MKKVAICLSGEARALEVTKRFYDSFASIDDYEVSVFIATWQSNYTDALSSIKNLKSIEVLKEELYYEHTTLGKQSNNYKYSFLLKRCNLLKQKYEIKNDIKFDCVIISRIDSIITTPREILSRFFDETKYMKFNALIAYGMHDQKFREDHTFIDDNLLVTNSITSDVYSNIHFLHYGETTNRRNFSLEINSYILNYYNINFKPGIGKVFIIRPSSVYDWLKRLKSINFLDLNLGDTMHQNKLKINNNRIQETIFGTVIIDLRKKDFLFNKLGYTTFLECYIDNIATKFDKSHVIFITEDRVKVENLNIKNRLRHKTLWFKKSMKEALELNFKNTIMICNPLHFLSYSHNDFKIEGHKKDLSLLVENNNVLNSMFILKKELADRFLQDKIEDTSTVNLLEYFKDVENKQILKVFNTIPLEEIEEIYNQL